MRSVSDILAALEQAGRIHTLVAQLVAILMIGYVGYELWDKLGESGSALYGRSDPWRGNVDIDSILLPGFKDGRVKEAYALLANHNQLDEDRVVSVSLDVSKREVVEGTSETSGEVKSDFLSRRAATLADEECDLLVETFAANCKVLRSGTQEAEAGQTYQISYALAFREKADLGPFDPKAKWMYSDLEPDPPSGRVLITDSKSSGATQRRARQRFYLETARNCVELRRRQMPCSISGITVRTVLRDGLEILVGAAKYGILTRRG